jgi:hypothetical protein
MTSSKDALDIELDEVKWILVIEKEVWLGLPHIFDPSNVPRQLSKLWQRASTGKVLLGARALS